MRIPGLPSSLHYGNLVNRACPLNRGLVSWWLTLPLGGKCATWFDIASKNHGTLTNGPTWSGALGRPGGCGALSLDGSNDAVTVATLAPNAITSNNAFSYACWFKFLGSGENLYDIFATSANANVAYYDNRGGFNRFTFTARNGFGGPSITASWTSDSNWHHIVGTYSGSAWNVYLDGANIATAGHTFTLPSTQSDWQNIGDGVGFTNWLGYKDDIRLYEIELSAAHVRAIYNDSRQGYPQTLNRIRPVRLGTAAVGGTAARARFYALLNVA